MIRTLKENEDYPGLFKNVFGYWDKYHNPDVVLVSEINGEIHGFLSGRWLTKREFHIQFAGVVPKFRNKKEAQYGQAECMDILKQGGVIYFSCETENDNVNAIKTVLNNGFKIVGTKTSEAGKCIVRWGKPVAQNKEECR